jgi:hypothetical protein
MAVRLDPVGMLDVVGYRAEPGFARQETVSLSENMARPYSKPR